MSCQPGEDSKVFQQDSSADPSKHLQNPHAPRTQERANTESTNELESISESRGATPTVERSGTVDGEGLNDEFKK
jgi:hypothetical protein